MTTNDSVWDEDISYLRELSEKNDIVLTDEMEDDYGYEVWALWNEGLTKEQARIEAYKRVIVGDTAVELM
jgi:hypothetical protein